MNYRLLILTTLLFGWAHAASAQSPSINWMSFEEAVEQSRENPKKFFIDFYTDWCGWCKRLDQVTFQDPEVIALLNKYYYPVKFDAEESDPVSFGGKEYVYVKPPNSRRGYHELAATLMQGKMSYPTMIIMQVNESAGQVEIITPIQGYLDGAKLEPILHYLGDDLHLKKVDWEEYRANYATNNGQ